VSIVCLIGISYYSLHWEDISSGEWREEMREAKKEVNRQKEVTVYTCSVAYMSHQFPALMKVTDMQEDFIAVPLIAQTDVGYQTGCELVSAAMVLQYYDSDAAPADVYTAIEVYSEDGSAGTTDRNPNTCFIGDPESTHGYGCYAPPLVTAMNQLLDAEWQAVNVSDFDLDFLEQTYIKQGIPVIIWATINMSEPKEGESWTLESGETIQWIAGEHCLVMVGADDAYYYFNDPNHKGDVIGYEKEVVQNRYEQLGRQAIVVSR
jgi:uncharacterized protein YvpB